MYESLLRADDVREYTRHTVECALNLVKIHRSGYILHSKVPSVRRGDVVFTVDGVHFEEDMDLSTDDIKVELVVIRFDRWRSAMSRLAALKSSIRRMRWNLRDRKR